MIDPKTLDELANKLSDLVPEQVKTAKSALDQQFKQALQSGLTKMDLVSREEFDAQTKVLARTRQLLEQLETKVSELEKKG